MILDYIRHQGEDGIGGVNFVAGVTKLGSDEATSVITPEFLGFVPGFFATDTEESVRSLESFLRLCFSREPSAAKLYLMLGYNVLVPPYVRQALFSALVRQRRTPPQDPQAGAADPRRRDAVLSPAVVDRHKAGMAHAQVHLMATPVTRRSGRRHLRPAPPAFCDCLT